MLSFFIQFVFICCVVVSQISFFNVVFSQEPANMILAVTVALIVTRGFFTSWFLITCLGLTFDLLSMNVVGVTPIVLLLFAYGVSFFSRRFLVEHKVSSLVIATFFVAGASFLYIPTLWIVQYALLHTPLSLNDIAAYFSRMHFIAGLLVNACVFIIAYGMIVKMNSMLDFYGNQVVVKR